MEKVYVSAVGVDMGKACYISRLKGMSHILGLLLVILMQYTFIVD